MTAGHRWLLTAVLLCPIALLASLYTTWLIAWMILGHMPRPSLDDPKSISGWVDLPYNLTLLLMTAFPAALVGGVFWIMWCGVRGKLSKLATVSALAALVTLWIAALMAIRLDPWRVGDWFMD